MPVTDFVAATARLSFRELCDDDFGVVHAYASDEEVVRFLPFGPNTENATLRFLKRARTAARAKPRVEYDLAVVRSEDGRQVGAVTLRRDGPDSPQAMLGYCLAREAWGYGYATEAAAAVLRLGFEELGLHRMWAGCDPDNGGSIRVLEKLGMRREAHFRQDFRGKTEWRDTLVYAMLADEWRAAATGASARRPRG